MLTTYFTDPKNNVTEEVTTEELSAQVEEFDTDTINIIPSLSWIDEWDNCHGDLILF